MAPVTNGRYLFNEFPTGMSGYLVITGKQIIRRNFTLLGYPTPGITTIHDTTQTIDLEEVPLNGGFLVKILVLSIDPLLRNRMDAPDPESSFNVGSLILTSPMMANVMSAV